MLCRNLLMFGMPLAQVVACATTNAAKVFDAFSDRGTLNIGAPADVAIMELREGSFEFLDNYEGRRTGRQRLFPIATVLDGRRVAARTQLELVEPYVRAEYSQPGGEHAARIVCEHMSRTLGQQFVIENVLGAGGTIGSMRAMRANPDGYNIQMGHLGTHATSVSSQSCI
jgi:hypothetical protein